MGKLIDIFITQFARQSKPKDNGAGHLNSFSVQMLMLLPFAASKQNAHYSPQIINANH